MMSSTFLRVSGYILWQAPISLSREEYKLKRNIRSKRLNKFGRETWLTCDTMWLLWFFLPLYLHNNTVGRSDGRNLIVDYGWSGANRSRFGMQCNNNYHLKYSCMMRLNIYGWYMCYVIVLREEVKHMLL